MRSLYIAGFATFSAHPDAADCQVTLSFDEIGGVEFPVDGVFDSSRSLRLRG